MINNPIIKQLINDNETVYNTYTYCNKKYMNDYEILEQMVINLAERNLQLQDQLLEYMRNYTVPFMIRGIND
jgi:hypothetical protein